MGWLRFFLQALEHMWALSRQFRVVYQARFQKVNGPDGYPCDLRDEFLSLYYILHALCSLVLEGLRSIVHASGISVFASSLDALLEVRVLELRRTFSGLLAVV